MSNDRISHLMDEELITAVMEALRSRYLATRYDMQVHWRDMALAAIEAVEAHEEKR